MHFDYTPPFSQLNLLSPYSHDMISSFTTTTTTTTIKNNLCCDMALDMWPSTGTSQLIKGYAPKNKLDPPSLRNCQLSNAPQVLDFMYTFSICMCFMFRLNLCRLCMLSQLL